MNGIIGSCQLAVRKDDLGSASLLLQFNAKIEGLTTDNWNLLRKRYENSDKPLAFEDLPKVSAGQQLQR